MDIVKQSSSTPDFRTTDVTEKKYIRTLAGDMETLKKGGAPDLVPLPSPLKTYSGDFSDHVKETNASTTTILAAEQDATPVIPTSGELKNNTAQHSSLSNIFYIIAGIVLLIAGGFGAYFAYTRYLSGTEPVVLAPIVSAPIFVDEREEISGTGVALFQEIEQSIGHTLATDSVRLLYTMNATSTDNSIFSALQMPAPNILLRNINSSDSMAGVINIAGDQSPFFIISVASYGDTFSGMLSWEPLMLHDLGKLFSSFPVASTSNATTTVASSTPKVVAGFRDDVINNHDVRIYRDAENRSVLLYGYWNQTTLVIARDSDAFSEILRRLASSRAQ